MLAVILVLGLAVVAFPDLLPALSRSGDPMPMHRTVGMSEAAGFQAIEIEDQGDRAGDRRGRQAVTVTTTRG